MQPNSTKIGDIPYKLSCIIKSELCHPASHNKMSEHILKRLITMSIKNLNFCIEKLS